VTFFFPQDIITFTYIFPQNNAFVQFALDFIFYFLLPYKYFAKQNTDFIKKNAQPVLIQSQHHIQPQI
jgi:hypothetical protein